VRIRDDHDVAGRIGERVETDKAVLAAKHDVGGPVCVDGRHPMFDCVPGGSNQVTKDAVTVARPGIQRGRHAFASTFAALVSVDQVSVAPGRPEIVHAPQVYGGAAGQNSRSTIGVSLSSPVDDNAIKIGVSPHF